MKNSEIAVLGVTAVGIILGAISQKFSDQNEIKNKVQTVQSKVDNFVIGGKIGTIVCTEQENGKSVELSYKAEAMGDDVRSLLKVRLGPKGNCHGVLPQYSQ